MFEKLNVLQTASAMARHAGERQMVVARNMANADTPGYRAQATPDFAETFGGRGAMRATRPGHLGSASLGASGERTGNTAPNGNSVSLETEMVAAAEVEREHERALTIYRHTLTVLRAVTTGR